MGCLPWNSLPELVTLHVHSLTFMYVQRIPPTHTILEQHVKSVVFQGGHIRGQIHVSQHVLPSLVHGTRLIMDYMNHTGPHFQDLLQWLLAACKKGCCRCCKCKKATCIGLSWCEATGQRNNSCITILHIMYRNWTSYALYNWSNITRWNAWICGASLRSNMQQVVGGIVQYRVSWKQNAIAPLPSVVQAFAAIGRASLCVFTLKAAQSLGPSAYSLSRQLGLGMSCTLFLQGMFIPTTVLSLKLLAYPT